MAVGWKTRIGLVLSAVWLCLVFLVADDYRRIEQTSALGVLPLVVIWGIVWAVSGWRAQRLAKPQTEEPVRAEARAKRRARIRTTVAVIAVFALGLFSATWQFKMADNEAGGHAVAGWFGEWLVYGLIAYAFLRAIPKLPYGAPAMLAALIIVGAVNWKAYVAIAEDRQALASLVRATPLINKVQSGVPVSDKEVVDARVGVLEPLMLAQAAYGREVAAISENYQKAVGGLAPEQMLTPASLASSDMRFQTRAKLKIWQQATAEYKSQIDAATARGKLGVQAALKQMPDAYARSTTNGFDDAAAQLMDYVNGHVATENDARQAVKAILDLLDANAGSYVVDKGPPPTLLFKDQATLEQYRRHFNAVLDVGKREQESQARFVQAQTSRTERLGDLFKK